MFAFAVSVTMPKLIAVVTPNLVVAAVNPSTTIVGVPDNPPEVPVAFPVRFPTNPPVDVVMPETFNLDICAVNIVAADDTLTSSSSVMPSTSISPAKSKFPLATILVPNVEIPETFKLVANDLVNVPIPDV